MATRDEASGMTWSRFCAINGSRPDTVAVNLYLLYRLSIKVDL
jgi:hypothetical protein